MEVKMSSSGVTAETSSETPEVGAIDMQLEVVTLPVSDVDRAKRFYQSLGWRLSYNRNLWMHHLTGGAAYLPR